MVKSKSEGSCFFFFFVILILVLFVGDQISCCDFLLLCYDQISIISLVVIFFYIYSLELSNKLYKSL